MPRHPKPQTKKDTFPIWIFAGGLGLILIALAVWYSQTQTADTSPGQVGPRLAVNTERVDLGKQPFDRMVRAQFTITNTGDRNLTLDASAPIKVVEGC